MSTPGERLSKHKQVTRSTSEDGQTQYRSTPQAAQVDCAIEITEALLGLKVAVNSLETNCVRVISNLIGEIEKATAQAVVSSEESTKVAIQSTKLSAQLNRLTKWVIAAAVLAALAAVVQAGVALYAMLK